MRRLLRKFFITLLAIVLVALIAGLVLLWLVQAPPSYYQPLALTPQQLEDAAKRAEDKFVEIRNVAGGAAAATSDSTFQVTFTQEELNAFLQKWTELSQVRKALGGRLTRPAVVLRADRLILAGKVNAGQLDSIVGVEFRPSIDGQGRLRMDIEQVSAGKLPVPLAMLSGSFSEGIKALRANLPRWRREARLQTNSSGAATFDDDAMNVVYAELLLAVLDGRAVEATFPIPLDGRRGVPAEITSLKLEDGAITAQVRLLTPAERADFLQRIKGDATP
jgi:hypothetical protein